MKSIGVIFVIAIVLGMFYGFWIVGVEVYGLINRYWDLINSEWQAILVLFSLVILVCSLIMSVSFKSSMKQYGIKGYGKVNAYNEFLYWYSSLKDSDEEILDAKPIKTVINQLSLWGSKHVASQVKILYSLVQEELPIKKDVLLELASDIYLEIRRDLGLRGGLQDNSIV